MHVSAVEYAGLTEQLPGGHYMRIIGIQIEPKDQVITLTRQAEPGDKVCYISQGISCEVTAAEKIPQYHKMACKDIAKSKKIYKYGNVIGMAVADIKAGAWVHVHNLKSICLAEQG